MIASLESTLVTLLLFSRSFSLSFIHSVYTHSFTYYSICLFVLGNGFLPQHLKMTNIFEESMQSVDKSVSLPYWDSTIEMAQGLSVFDSPVFTADTFGSLPSPKDEYWGK